MGNYIFEDRIIINLKGAARVVERIVAEHCEQIRITANQMAILIMLQRVPGSIATELSKTLRIDKSLLSKIVHDLKAKGLVEYRRPTPDSRSKGVWLTKKGEAKAQEALTVAQEIDHLIAETINQHRSFIDKLKALGSMGGDDETGDDD